MYDLLRAALFRLPEELSHQFTLSGLDACQRLGLLSRLAGARIPDDPREVFGLRFPNPVGLAAGLDKNADHLDSLGALGFGFIEVGTVTPQPQPGNAQPRLFRLPEQRAIINRMGFNNKGLDHLVARIAKRRYRGVLGVNIGKNVFTPVERAVDDYLACLRGVYAHADYVVVNLSSPNTPGLRSLQFGAPLDELLSELKREQAALRESQQRQVPLLLKIAPDLADEEIRQIAASLLRHGVEGVIATNTTVEREAVREARHGSEAGGLSGAPLRAQATQVTRVLHEALGGALPIIGVGGIESGQAARERVAAGASLVQVYTGFIYRGPGLLREIAEALRGIDATQAEQAPSQEQTP